MERSWNAGCGRRRGGRRRPSRRRGDERASSGPADGPPALVVVVELQPLGSAVPEDVGATGLVPERLPAGQPRAVPPPLPLAGRPATGSAATGVASASASPARVPPRLPGPGGLRPLRRPQLGFRFGLGLGLVGLRFGLSFIGGLGGGGFLRSHPRTLGRRGLVGGGATASSEGSLTSAPVSSAGWSRPADPPPARPQPPPRRRQRGMIPRPLRRSGHRPRWASTWVVPQAGVDSSSATAKGSMSSGSAPTSPAEAGSAGRVPQRPRSSAAGWAGGAGMDDAPRRAPRPRRRCRRQRRGRSRSRSRARSGPRPLRRPGPPRRRRAQRRQQGRRRTAARARRRAGGWRPPPGGAARGWARPVTFRRLPLRRGGGGRRQPQPPGRRRATPSGWRPVGGG